MEMTLAGLMVGNFAYVKEIRVKNALKQRLIDLGLTPHVCIYKERVAPLGDPMIIQLRNYRLCIRKKDAKNILLR